MALGGALAQAFVRLRVDSSVVAADTAKGLKEGAEEAQVQQRDSLGRFTSNGAAGDAEKSGESAGAKYSKGFNKAFKVAAIGALAIAAIGAASVKSAVDFQSAMTKIQTQAGASKSQVAQLTGEVLKLAPSTQQGPIELANALFHLKSVGLDNVDAMKALKVASDLAAVGGANLEDTTNAIAGAWRSGISGAHNFGQAASTVNAIIGAGNMRMQDFVTAIGTGILPAARTFGVSLSQVGGALALMTDEGVPAVDAATRLKMSFSLLAAPSATAEKQLKSIGLTGLQLANTMRSPSGLVGTIALLKHHLDASGLSASKQAILLSHAFGGGRSSSAILTMINNLDTLRKKQDQITQGMGKYGSAVAAQRQTAEAQLKILKSSVETIGVRIGLALLPPLTKFVKFLASDVVPGIVHLGGILGPILKNPYVQAFAGSLVAALLTIKGIIVAVKLWNAATLLLDAAQAAGPLGITIVAVAALAAGIAILWERSSTFRKVVESAFHAVLSVVKTVWTWIKSHWELLAAILLAPFAPVILGALALYKLVTIVIRVFDSIKKAITGGFDGWWKSHGKELEEVWKAVWSTIRFVFNEMWSPVVHIIKGDMEAIADIFKAGMAVATAIFRIGWGNISAGARGAWDLISGIVKAAWAIISGVVKIAVAGITSVIKIAWDIIVGIFNVALDLVTGHWSKAWTDIQNMVTQVWNAIKQFLGSTWKDIGQMAAAAWNALIGGVKSMGSDLLGYFKRLPGMIVSALGDVAHLLWNAGVSIVKGLIGGIGSMIGAVGHAIGNVASEIVHHLPFSPAKKGPLSGKGDPHYSGLSIGKKLAAGIKASLPGIKAAIKESASAIHHELAKAATEKAAGTKGMAGLESHKKSLENERAKEESQIKKLIAERAKEYAASHKGSEALRKAQEAQIKTIEKLRRVQETQVKQTEQVIKALRSEMSKLTSETKKLASALAKANKAASSSSSSSSDSSSGDSSGSDSSSADASPNWGAFSQWLIATNGASVSPASGGSWQGNPGPLGGFGIGLSGAPRPLGRPGGRAQGNQDAIVEKLNLLIGRMDEQLSVARQQPGRTAAGLNAAMNGVTAKAIVRGNW